MLITGRSFRIKLTIEPADHSKIESEHPGMEGALRHLGAVLSAYHEHLLPCSIRVEKVYLEETQGRSSE